MTATIWMGHGGPGQYLYMIACVADPAPLVRQQVLASLRSVYT